MTENEAVVVDPASLIPDAPVEAAPTEQSIDACIDGVPEETSPPEAASAKPPVAPDPRLPRELNVIQKEAAQLFNTYGQMNFEHKMLENNMNNVLMRLQYVNNEAAERQEIIAKREALDRQNREKIEKDKIAKAEQKRLAKGAAQN